VFAVLLQCSCSVLQHYSYRVLQRITGGCSVLQSIAEYCTVLTNHGVASCCSVLHCGCIVLKCVAVWLQCDTACCSVVQCVAQGRLPTARPHIRKFHVTYKRFTSRTGMSHMGGARPGNYRALVIIVRLSKTGVVTVVTASVERWGARPLPFASSSTRDHNLPT